MERTKIYGPPYPVSFLDPILCRGRNGGACPRAHRTRPSISNSVVIFSISSQHGLNVGNKS